MRHAVMLGARRLSYLEAGHPAGRVLVLLHAFPLTAQMWLPQLLAPPHGWRLIAPDLAGLGSTDDHEDERVALQDYAEDVVALLDRLGIRRARVGGLSLGGYVTLAVARLAPERVDGLVLADTKAPADTAEQRAARDRLIATLHDGGPDAVAVEMLPRLVGQTTARQQPELLADVRSQIGVNRAVGIRRAILRLRDRPDARPGLAAITVPTLVIAGDEDVPTPVAEAELLVQHITGARLEILAGAGHLSNLERPEAFTAALTRFLSP
jgi:pimeloyl-ACP methyl ester carboxylesterase